MSKPVSLELRIDLNGQLLAVVPLQLPEGSTLAGRSDPIDPATPQSDEPVAPIRVEMHLVGEACSAGADAPLIEAFIPLQPEILLGGQPKGLGYRYEMDPKDVLRTYTHTICDYAGNPVKIADTLGPTTTCTYDSQRHRPEPPAPSDERPPQEPPEDPPFIVEK